MATTPSIAAGTPRGIQNTLAGFVIETESIVPNDVSEQVPDQKGAVADEISYDTRTNLRLTVRSATTGTTPYFFAMSAGISFTISGLIASAFTWQYLRPNWSATVPSTSSSPMVPPETSTSSVVSFSAFIDFDAAST